MRTLLILAIIVTGSACNNDINILAPYEDIPIVYCVLNQNDSTHYLRLEKSFAGEMDAYQMASVADSIYYPSAKVKIERWREGEFREILDFNEIDYTPRDPGIFAHQPNRIFANSDTLDGASEYRLKIFIPGKEDSIVARTHLVDNIRIIKPAYFQQNMNLSQYNGEIQVEWKSAPHARIYFLQVRFNYLEVLQNDTTTKSALWNIAHYISENDLGQETMKSEILHENFYKWLPSKIQPASDGIRRIAHKKAFDFVFTIGGEELYTFMQIYDPDQGINQEKPVYTNISGGIGLFSARHQQEINGKSFTYASIDSLAWGIHTRHLGFVDSGDDYYNRQ